MSAAGPNLGSICQLGADIKRWENVSSSKKNEERFAENEGGECRKRLELVPNCCLNKKGAHEGN